MVTIAYFYLLWKTTHRKRHGYNSVFLLIMLSKTSHRQRHGYHTLYFCLLLCVLNVYTLDRIGHYFEFLVLTCANALL
jgi:hypothetical protein